MSLVNKKESLKTMGFSPKTLSLMTESEISKLFKNFIYESKKETKEEVTTNVKKTTFDPVSQTDRDKLAARGIMVDPSSKKVTIQGETAEGKTSKKSKKNPWAICTSVMGAEFGSTERSDWSKKQMDKYEKCVMGVKKSIKEGKNPEEVLLENKFRTIIEKNLRPTITKGDLLNMINEQPVETPVKPKTKPNVKPGSPLPNPGSLPKPKAAGTKEAPVKPTTKPRVKPGSPLPNPGSLPKPKAINQLPDFMQFSEYKKWEK
jgi:hypothetical protein